MAWTAAEAREVTHRWLAEERIGRDSIRLALPPSRLAVGAGDTVALQGGLWRVDRGGDGRYGVVEAVRVETGAYRPGDIAEEIRPARRIAAPVPCHPVFLDLPLLTGNEIAHAPHVAVAADPWPGPVGVWSSAEAEARFELNRMVAAPAVIGVTESPLAAARPGLWDRACRCGSGLPAGS